LDTITLVIAIWGAGLATVLGIREILNSRGRLIVRIHPRAIIGSDYPGDKQVDQLIINAANRKSVPVTISGCSLRIRGEKWVYYLNPSNCGGNTIPHEVVQGKDWNLWLDSSIISEQAIANNLSGSVKLRAELNDQTGRHHRSRYIKFHVEEHLQSEKERGNEI